MTDAFVHVNGHRVTHLRLHVGNVGPWHLEADFEGEPELTGQVTAHVGALALVGTVAPRQTGRFGLQTRTRIDAGAGGWARELARKHYHNDGGVLARTIAVDAAREAGEQLGTFVPASERVGRDFVREQGLASTTLEAAIGAVPWHVDYAGVTHVGARAAVEASPEAYKVLAFDPRSKWATLSVDDPRTVTIGSVISQGLEVPGTVREFELVVTPDELRMRVWLGGGDNEPGKLAMLMRSIIERASDGRLLGVYRYRVVSMAPDGRVNLQAVRKDAGLPDAKPISMWPGVAGVHAELAAGAEVLVQFLEGDRTMPIITSFAGVDGKGFVPEQITLAGDAGSEVVRKGDAVEVLLPPFVAAGLVTVPPPVMGVTVPTPMPFQATFTSSLGKAIGVATGGSTKVKSA
jgi:hypothetical protein